MNQTEVFKAIDSDGVPPGLDTELSGKYKTITFSGHFYARPRTPYMEFSRPVLILFANNRSSMPGMPWVFTALDIETHNLYVVDRNTGISLGCLMHAALSDFKGKEVHSA